MTWGVEDRPFLARYMGTMRRGFLRFSFDRKRASQKRIDESVKEFETLLAQGHFAPKADATESAVTTREVSKPQATGAVSGQPQPKDFGVTPEQVAAYRPPDPNDPGLGWTLLIFSVCVAVIVIFTWSLRSGVGRSTSPGWLNWLHPPILLLVVAAYICGLVVSFTLVGYVFRGIGSLFTPYSARLPADVRCCVESYLRARTEYEQALKQAELERRRRQEDYWCKLSGRDFETELARLYKLAGYAVETTPVTGDEGADLLLRKDGELIVVQCKRQDKPVGPHIVRDLHGTMHHFGAARAFLDATGGFTEGVRQYARGKPIELHDLDYILSLQAALTDPKTSRTTS